MTVVGVEADGRRAVVVKRASAAGAPHLQREGERLRQASHPGVVQLLSSAPADGGWELRTAHAGQPLSALGALTTAQVAAIVAAVASTLADLHQIGVVHGRIDASHVLVGEHGRPVICGFGEGSDLAHPGDDVAALGALLAERLGRDEEPEPIPERRWGRRRAWTAWDRRTLLLLADQACAEPATRRPTARRLAAAISEAVPAVAAIGPDAAREVDPAGGLRRLRGAALALVGVVVLAAGLVRSGAPIAPDQQPSSSEVEPLTTSSTTPGRQVATAIADSTLVVDGHRYRVGQAGDEVLVDDWDCDGTATPALLRPRSGEVYVFPRWAERGPLTVEPLLTVAGAAELVSDAAGGGCPSLAVETESGDLVPVMDSVVR